MADVPAAAPASTTEAPPDTEGAAPAAPPPPRMFKLKVNGQESEHPEAEVIAWAQKQRAGEDRLQAAAQAARQLAAEREAFAQEKARFQSADPVELLKARGVDPQAWAADLLVQAFGAEAAPPEQRQLQEALREKAALEAKLAQTEKAQQDAAARAHQERAEAWVGEVCSRALKTLGVEGPAAAPYVSRMGHVLKALEAGLAEQVKAGVITEAQAVQEIAALDVNALAGKVQESVRAEQTAAWKGLEGDALLAAVGPEQANAIVKAWVGARERAATAPPAGAEAPARVLPSRGANGQFTTTAQPVRRNTAWDNLFGQGR